MAGIILTILIIILSTLVFFALKNVNSIKSLDSRSSEGERKSANRRFNSYTIALAGLIIMYIASSFNLVSEGEISTKVCFGSRDVSYIQSSGLYLANPYCSYSSQSTKEETVSFNVVEDLSNTPLTRDKVKVDTEVNFPVSVNPMVIPYLLNIYGSEENYRASLINNSVYDAIRRGFSEFYWDIPSKEDRLKGIVYKAINDSRDDLVDEISRSFEFIIKEKMKKAGVEDRFIDDAFSIGYPTVGKITPPRSISEAVNEKKKAREELSRQSTITEIATEKAVRGTQEGLRIKNMLGQIPGYDTEKATVHDSVLLVNALASMARAEALETAVKEGGVDIWVTEGGNASIAAPAPKSQ